MEEEIRAPKAHRKSQSGVKAEKRKRREGKKDFDPAAAPERRNPKAFSIQSVNKVQKAVRRTLDVKERRHHIPMVDRTPVEPPPVLAAVVGPPKVGKTTLIQCLVRNFTRQKVSKILGPITVVSGKSRRITFVECNNDINCMIDIAKAADLVLLMVDASFGFDMQTFEFLNICQVHGAPRIMGVLTHLDGFKDNKKLRTTKKELKQRFWKEVDQKAKLFYLSGIINKEYQKQEIHNLGRFISIMKFRPLVWRTTHPYLVADRMEDVTDPETIRQNSKTDRSVCLYGYVRGTHLLNNSNVHIPGVGDYAVANMSSLPDPCPLPNKEKMKRSLNEKERLIYAPMAGVGGVLYDKDAVYIDLGGSHAMREDADDETSGNKSFVSQLIDNKSTIDEKLQSGSVSLLKGVKPLQGDASFDDDENQSDDDEDDDDSEEGSDDDISEEETDDKECADSDLDTGNYEDSEDDNSDDDSSEEEEDDNEQRKTKRRKMNTDLSLDDDDSESDDSELEDFLHKGGADSGHGSEDDESSGDESDDVDGMLRWKTNLRERASAMFLERQRTTTNLRTLVYGGIEDASSTNDNQQDKPGSSSNADNDSDDETVGGIFKVLQQDGNHQASTTKQPVGSDSLTMTGGANDTDSSRLCTKQETPHWEEEQMCELLKNLFVTGAWSDKDDAETLLKQDDELYGDFEDLETGEKHTAGDFSGSSDSEDGESDGEGSGSQDGEMEGSDEEEKPAIKKTYAELRKEKLEKKRAEKKARTKAMFDAMYDEQKSKGEGNDGGSTYFEDLKAEMDEQAKLNRAEFESMDDDTRAQYEGYRPGVYVRVQIDNMPCELVVNHNPEYPIVLGALLSAEHNVGYVQVKLKKHRWHKRILKTRDPLVISLGWRRFQSMPLYSVKDHNDRHRLLKYTPEHLHCNATFYGPITPQGTGMLAVTNSSDAKSLFRVNATGVVVELDKSIPIVKKLKLTGTPFKIFKKTAFIHGMFNSKLEVAKFEGSIIRSVSGLRGQIKGALSSPEGAFRATFEDKILISDIVFIRTWYTVAVPKFYNCLYNLLMSDKDKQSWLSMRTVGQLKRDKGIHYQPSEDSLYKAPERRQYHSRPLVIPAELQKNLPFASRIKTEAAVDNRVEKQRVAVVMEPKERKVEQLLKRCRAIHEAQLKKEKRTHRDKQNAFKERKMKEELKNEDKFRAMKKSIHRAEGKEEKRKEKGRHGRKRR